MLTSLLCACLLLTQNPDGNSRQEPDPVKVEEVLAGLDKAQAMHSESALINALIDCQEVEDKAVIERVAAALKHRKTGVRKTAVNVLRWMKHPEALAALAKSYKQDKRLHQLPDLVSRTLRAIGQHAEPSSLDLFVNPPAEWKDDAIVRARIRGIGRLRTKAAVAALIALIDSKQAWNVHDYAADFRISLRVLTGVDQGPHLADWKLWWRDNREAVVVGEKLPKLPPEVVREWRTYWGLPIEADANDKAGHGRSGRRRDHHKKER